MVMKMKKKKELAVMLFAAALCVGVWALRPSFFEKDNGIIYAKSYNSSNSAKSLYNTTAQEEIQQNIENLKEKNEYSEDSPLLIYNPYGTNTLSMYAYFETSQNATVSYTIHVKDESIEDFTRTLNTTMTSIHESQLIGLIPNMDNEIIFHITYEDGTQKDVAYSYIMEGILGEEEVQLEKTEGTSTQQVSDGLYVVLGNDSEEDDFMYFYDNNGVLRGEIPIEEYRSHRLIFHDDKMYYSYNKTKMAEMNSLGQITNTYDLGDYELHHDYVFDDDGSMLILATDTTADTEEDVLIKLDIVTKEVSLLSDMGDLLPKYKASTKEANDTWDWIHLNTLQWIGNDEIIVSSRETSTIIKISNIYDTPTIDYMIGEESFWEGSEYEELVLDKIGTFASQTGQHSVTYVEDENLPDGQYYLYMFNNNYGYSATNTEYDWSQIEGVVTGKAKKDSLSNYYKYLVDETAGTYTLVDSFDVPYSAYVSSAQNTDTTTIIDSGMAKNFQEYDRDHNLIQSFNMEAETFMYRVYKYTFDDFYFNK